MLNLETLRNTSKMKMQVNLLFLKKKKDLIHHYHVNFQVQQNLPLMIFTSQYGISADQNNLHCSRHLQTLCFPLNNKVTWGKVRHPGKTRHFIFHR